MTLRILVVDDDPSLRQGFIDAVDSTRDMSAVGGAATLAEGLHLLRTLRPDVLLVDLGLPDGNGIELIKFAARHHPDCDVMVISVFGDEYHVLASLVAGATGYLLKDARASEIVEQVRVLRSGGSPISAVIARQLLLRFVATAGGVAPANPDGPELLNGESSLSPREREVLLLCAKGYSYEEVGPMLGISRHTVTTFVKRIYRKLQVHSKTEALYEARLRRLIDE